MRTSKMKAWLRNDELHHGIAGMSVMGCWNGKKKGRCGCVTGHCLGEVRMLGLPPTLLLGSTPTSLLGSSPLTRRHPAIIWFTSMLLVMGPLGRSNEGDMNEKVFYR